MRKSLILFVLLFAYIWGCTSSEDEYSLVSKDDRRAISAFCKCLEPLSPYLDKIKNTNDSLTRVMYADSFETKLMEYAPCLEKAEKIEAKFGESEEYTKQFIQYVKDKHPKCIPYWLGTETRDTFKIENK